jgi:sporulation protein YlmC with PRC-barrel domain
MAAQKVHLELLVGKVVHDAEGKKVGRIRSVHAEKEGDDCVVRHWELGGAALLSRFGISALRLVGWPLRKEPRKIPWDQMDLSDPEKPRLKSEK